MPMLTKEEAQTMKGVVFDLSENGAKQSLYGMIEILTEHPSVLTKVFSLIVDDARKFTNFTRRTPPQ
jgi:hypothetical protein